MVNFFFKLLFIFTFVLFYSISAIAQNGMNFQGVARNSNNVILASQPISIRLSVLKGTTTGNIEYQETKTINTNAQGLFNLVIGDGTAISSTGTYGNINWQEFPKFIKIEMDANAGNNFITLGTTQLQYVAYAYFANGVAAENIVGLVPVARGGTGSSNLLDLKNNLQLDKVNNTADSLKPLSKAVLSAMLTKLNVSDTVNLSNRINNKLNYADTLSLSNRISTKMSFVDTLNMSSRIDGKLNIADTISLSKRIDLKGDLSDGIAALATKANTNDLTTGLSSKVDKVSGKDLSSNDFTTAEKSKLTAITGTNTGDQDLSSYVTSSALALKAPLNNPVFTSDIVVNGLTLGLGGANISNNTVFGKESFVSNTTGHNNVAIGLHSLFRNTTGFENVAIGYAAMPLNVDGSWNVAFGGGAMNSIQTGNDNIAIGGTTLYGLYSGSKNTVIGVAAMHSTSSGESNTAIGYNASGNISTGSYNTVIGAEAKIAAGTFSNSVAIGYNASAHASNTIQLGNTDITNVVTSGVVSATAFTGPLNGNAATATKLLSAKNINGVAFDGSADITVTSIVDAGTLTGTTLASNVVNTSITRVGVLTNTTVNGKLVVGSTSENASSAILEVNSSSKGFLPPRMGYAQRNAIANPELGLVIYCNDCGVFGELQIFNGYNWTNYSGTTRTLNYNEKYVPDYGDYFEGGIVVYLLSPSDPGYEANYYKGFILALTDAVREDGVTSEVPLNISPYLYTSTSTSIGSGITNTNTFINVLGNTTTHASGLARSYRGGGFTDWYLPSAGELRAMDDYANSSTMLHHPLLNIFDKYFWTSSYDHFYTEGWTGMALFYGIYQGDFGTVSHFVRPIRNFKVAK